MKCRERVEKCRAKKKQSSESQMFNDSSEAIGDSIEQDTSKSQHTSIQFSHSFKTYGALAKAVTKTRKTLPKSPSKKTAVIAKLVYSLDEKNQLIIFNNKTTMKRGGNKGVSAELVDKIELFYQRDDVSRMSPNVKDTRNFVDPKTSQKELKQIRHLVVTLKQAYDLFDKENSGE